MTSITALKGIAEETRQGLTSSPKYLLPKNFYDDNGSRIFQDIMGMPEYYLTDCETEIFSTLKQSIMEAFTSTPPTFDLIELGSGDGVKTKILLSHFINQGVSFKYIPVDISEEANKMLKDGLKASIPQLYVEPKTGNYFNVLKEMSLNGQHPRIFMFLGANIGNFSHHEVRKFLSELGRIVRPGDKLFIGFDLKKSPEIIMKAYSDEHGHTRRFNLNHLTRINRELGADFNPENFEHHTSYNPISGAVRSYLVSQKAHTVNIKHVGLEVGFKQWEPIYMELSQKYNLHDIDQLANENGFSVIHNFVDSRGYFADSLWELKTTTS